MIPTTLNVALTKQFDCSELKVGLQITLKCLTSPLSSGPLYILHFKPPFNFKVSVISSEDPFVNSFDKLISEELDLNHKVSKLLACFMFLAPAVFEKGNGAVTFLY